VTSAAAHLPGDLVAESLELSADAANGTRKHHGRGHFLDDHGPFGRLCGVS